MTAIPDLAGVATADLVEKISAGSFAASYINWSRTVELLRKYAPGWMPELSPGADSVLHRAPLGAYLLIRFRHIDGTITPEVPQAVMDHKNAAIPYDKITARDITDTHRRGVCLAAAFTFGLAYELWAKMPLESGFAQAQEPKPAGKPQDGMQIQDMPDDRQILIHDFESAIVEQADAGKLNEAAKTWKDCDLAHEEKIALWGLLPSHHRSAIKRLSKAA